VWAKFASRYQYVYRCCYWKERKSDISIVIGFYQMGVRDASNTTGKDVLDRNQNTESA